MSLNHVGIFLIVVLGFIACNGDSSDDPAPESEDTVQSDTISTEDPENNVTGKKPNIVLILADDLGWGDVGYHGSDIMTPNLDNLAAEGVTLDRFYTSPICTPTRAGLLTGRYPDRYGLRNDVIRPWAEEGLDLDEQLLPEFLANYGYENRALIGKWHLGHGRWAYHPMNRGFTYFYGHLNGAIGYNNLQREGERDWHENFAPSADEGYSTDLITNKAIEKLKSFANAGSPFFMEVAYNAPHTPLVAQREYLDMYGFDPDIPRFEPGKGKGNTERQTYAAMVTNMDDGIGDILDELNSLGLSDNTLVLFFSDNGADEKNKGGSSGELRGAKLTEWEGGIRAPALIRWPEAFEGGWELEQYMTYLDIFPTIAEVIDPSYQTINPLDGSNVIELLTSRGQTSIENREIYVSNGVLISDEFKLIQDVNVNSNMEEVTEDLLYNIFTDPQEISNIRQVQSAKYNELLQLIEAYESIEGVSPVPPGGKPSGWTPPKDWIPTN